MPRLPTTTAARPARSAPVIGSDAGSTELVTPPPVGPLPVGTLPVGGVPGVLGVTGGVEDQVPVVGGLVGGAVVHWHGGGVAVRHGVGCIDGGVVPTGRTPRWPAARIRR